MHKYLHLSGLFSKYLLSGFAALCCSSITAIATPAIVVSSTTNVCTNFAPGGASPFWQTINSFGISEQANGDFGSTTGSFSSTIEVVAPAGWEFNASATPAVVASAANLDGTATITLLTASSLIFTISGTGNDALDQVTISNLQIRPTSASSVAGNLTVNISGAPLTGIANGNTLATVVPQIPASGAAAVTINASATSVCSGTTVTFTTNTTNAGTNTLFQWQIDGTDIAGATSSTYSSSALSDGDDVTVLIYGNECINSPNALSAVTEIEVKPLPTAITGNTGVCVGATVTFGSTPAAGTWSSDHTAKATVNATTGVVSGISSGTANISYQSPNGCYVSAVATVIATPAPITGTNVACAGSTQTLSSATPGGTWASDNTVVATVSATGAVTGIASGTASITYTVVSGCATSAVFTVNAVPMTYNVTGTGSYCADGGGLPVGISGSEAGVTYHLYDGSTLQGTFTGTGSAMTFGAYTAAATYTVLATNALSCSSAMTGDATITILPMVTPIVTIIPTPGDTVCSGTAVTFTTTSVNGGVSPVFVWRINGTQMGTGNTYNYTPTDGDLVNVTLISDEACPSPAQVNDEITMVVIPSLSPTVTINATSSSVCQYSPVTFSVSSFANGGTAPAFTWVIDGISTGITGNTYTYMPADGDTITARISSNYRCPLINNVPSNAVGMNVDSMYLPVVDITTNTGLYTRVGSSVTFTAHVANAGAATPNYQWFKNGIALNGEISKTYTTSSIANNDSVSCVVWAAGLCSSGTPGFNSVKMTVTTGIDDITANNTDITLLPNPNNGTFVIKGDFSAVAGDNIMVSITNVLGQRIYTTTAIPNNSEISISAADLADGMYLLQVHGTGIIATTRLVIKH